VYDRSAVTPDPLLLAAIRAVARSGDADATLDELLEIGLRAAGADHAAAFLWDANQGGLALAGSRGYAPDDLAALETAVAAAGHPVQLAAQERLQATGKPGAGGRVLAAWPVVIGRDGIEEPVGALALEGDAAPAAEAGERVAALADLIAVVVDRARMSEDAAERIDWAQRVANSDLLTGLANAHTLSRVLELEIVRAARQRSELSLAVFDIDDLTSYNAAQGRGAGDDVLRQVAVAISESIRLVDTVARWGGDEFMLVAPGATGSTVVQRIIDRVAAITLPDDRRITMSVGLAHFPDDGTVSDELVFAAKAALRAAQAVGPGTMAEATRAAEAASQG
jgi:diguanylate cyclase (GGDEF)-like protein